MITPTSQPGDDFLQEQRDFSLVLGGPLFQLLRRAHLSDETSPIIRRRVIFSMVVAWLPLLVLSALEGNVWGGTAVVPFLKDVETHSRFLVALPLLIIAELVVHQRMRNLVEQFLERNLIPESGMAQFKGAIASIFRLRNSVLAEVLLIAFVYVVGILIVWRQNVALDTTTWYAAPSAEGSKLSFAGLWLGYISLPIFQFLLLRWYFRFFLWTRFLWQVSRIDLQLVPTHPDRAGGLGFLTTTVYAFVPLVVAHGALLSGLIGNRIFHVGATLPDFKLEIFALALFSPVRRARPAVGFCAAAHCGQAEGPARIRHPGRALRPRVRYQMAARWCAGR